MLSKVTANSEYQWDTLILGHGLLIHRGRRTLLAIEPPVRYQPLFLQMD